MKQKTERFHTPRGFCRLVPRPQRKSQRRPCGWNVAISATVRMECGNFGDHKSVGGGVWERSIDFEKGYRLYYAKDGDELILLFCGGTKSRQQSDINKAKQYWKDYKKRKKQKKTDDEAQTKPKRKKRNKK